MEKKPQFTKKEGALASLLLSLSKALPMKLVGLLGGPMTAGALVLVAGGLAVGGASIYFGVMAAGVKKPPYSATGESAFNKFFGSPQGVSENVLGPDAMRAANLEGEEPHPDEDTSLGYMIPDKTPEAKDKKYKKADGTEMDADMAKALKGRFASKAGELEKGGSSMVMGGGSAGGSGLTRQVSFGAGGSGSAGAGGTSARSRKAAIRDSGARISTRRTSAMKDLKRAGKILGQAPRMDQMAAGYTGAAFGEAPKSAGIIPGGPAAVVGQVAPSAGLVNQPDPAKLGASGEVEPTSGLGDKKSNFLKGAWQKEYTTALIFMGIALLLGVGLATAFPKLKWVFKIAAVVFLVMAIGSIIRGMNKKCDGTDPTAQACVAPACGSTGMLASLPKRSVFVSAAFFSLPKMAGAVQGPGDTDGDGGGSGGGGQGGGSAPEGEGESKDKCVPTSTLGKIIGWALLGLTAYLIFVVIGKDLLGLLKGGGKGTLEGGAKGGAGATIVPTPLPPPRNIDIPSYEKDSHG